MSNYFFLLCLFSSFRKVQNILFFPPHQNAFWLLIIPTRSRMNNRHLASSKVITFCIFYLQIALIRFVVWSNDLKKVRLFCDYFCREKNWVTQQLMCFSFGAPATTKAVHTVYRTRKEYFVSKQKMLKRSVLAVKSAWNDAITRQNYSAFFLTLFVALSNFWVHSRGLNYKKML